MGAFSQNNRNVYFIQSLAAVFFIFFLKAIRMRDASRLPPIVWEVDSLGTVTAYLPDPWSTAHPWYIPWWLEGGGGELAYPFIYSLYLCLLRARFLISVKQARLMSGSGLVPTIPHHRPPPTPMTRSITWTRPVGLVCAWVCRRNHLSPFPSAR